MKCVPCGAGLRKADLFCRRCGTLPEKTREKSRPATMRVRRPARAMAALYRDFLTFGPPKNGGPIPRNASER
ncbi:MAG: hypothetical protein A3G34_06785 [Candidatus Lindowbacteria bacterium RIFCSPLOWO2_12_FULL_62_27]|nr:MAG: hypothetical protein A3G34_06785 [Candidatus Lindowbacteria bacterium RIFCSPLOWO2_12_FULL_62_27]OGH62297.1 MAG: hypothetical protein A3I06_14395 [Candidatus Lindowbacteria bacterium RIFCSPLOWO2_02_FULL_62_12]